MQRDTGTVDSFDEAAGYGTVVDPSGQEWFFHCTAVADGSRTIETGTVVAFEIAPGRMGRWEAVDLRPVTTPGPDR